MRKRSDFLWRYIFFGAAFVFVLLSYIVVLINLQISGQDYYLTVSPVYGHSRSEKIQAQRGEIYDRNGVKLVGNKYYYNIDFDYGSLPGGNEEKNSVILSVADYGKASGDPDMLKEPTYHPFDITINGGRLSFEYNVDFESSPRKAKFDKLLEEMGLKDDVKAEDSSVKLLERYGITDKDSNYIYSADASKIIFEYRLDFELTDFSAENPYTILRNVSIEDISALKESEMRGFTVYSGYERVYYFPGYLSHILGRVGKIPAEKVDYYTEKGYKLDATVGVSGIEEVFEDYLHGEDGEIIIYEDSMDNITGSKVISEAVPGKDVYLTIDIYLQMASEDALAYNIEYVRMESLKEGEKYTGEDAEAGAITAVNPKNGEILVLGSYPTYDLSTFLEDLPYLSADETHPMLNRALHGTYQPGSTFKPCVAVAALDTGLINRYTTIIDEGQYKYYESYQPRCWIYLMFGQTHGAVDVTKAIQESCNYFFYDVGRRLTIETINSYASKFGLGQNTGIELSEETGVLAGPDYRSDNGLEAWNPGDVLQAAIGQSDYIFTPLQLSTYVSALVNRGTRYSAHILYKVCEYNTAETVYEYEPAVLDRMELSDEACDVVLEAMKHVIENGSVSEFFEDYPVTIGGKTGTAQVSSTKSDNAVFTAFAPFDNPEIVVSNVIEQGNTGANAGVAVKGLLDHYFKIDEKDDEDEDDEKDTGSQTDDGERDNNGEDEN